MQDPRHLYFHLGDDYGFRAVRFAQEPEIAPSARQPRRADVNLGMERVARSGRDGIVPSGSDATTTIEVQSRSLGARGEPQHVAHHDHHRLDVITDLVGSRKCG